jgi:hypothetical protein
MFRTGWLIALAVLVAAVAAEAASAGSGGSKTGQACYKGAYANYLNPATGTSFASQAACVSYVANGGTLFSGVDLGLSASTPSTQNFAGGQSGDFSLTNYGSVSETYTATFTITIGLNCSTCVGGGALVSYVGSPGCSFGSTPDTETFTCSGTIAAGATTRVLSVDAVDPVYANVSGSITAAQYPDPVSSNNAVQASIDFNPLPGT